MIEIHSITSYPELLGDVCNLLWSEFGNNYTVCSGMTDKDDLLFELQSIHLCSGDGTEKLPMLIAVDIDNSELVGVCNMVNDDLGFPWNRRLNYSPWIANVIVKEAYRNRGWGTKLLETMIYLAFYKRMTTEVLYLWNNSDSLTRWYETFGFKEVTTIPDFMNLYPKITIMALNKNDKFTNIEL